MKNFNPFVLAVLAILSFVSVVNAQEKKAVSDSRSTVRSGGGDDRLKDPLRYQGDHCCRAGAINVDGRRNGGVRVKRVGSQRNSVRYRLENQGTDKRGSRPARESRPALTPVAGGFMPKGLRAR
jgi:hypothetical protein